MIAVRRFALGVWDFVVGDDWITAIGVVVALGATALVAGAWWLTPLIVLSLLVVSLARARR
jgi:hypothetical protein